MTNFKSSNVQAHVGNVENGLINEVINGDEPINGSSSSNYSMGNAPKAKVDSTFSGLNGLAQFKRCSEHIIFKSTSPLLLYIYPSRTKMLAWVNQKFDPTLHFSFHKTVYAPYDEYLTAHQEGDIGIEDAAARIQEIEQCLLDYFNSPILAKMLQYPWMFEDVDYPELHIPFLERISPAIQNDLD